MAAGLLGIVKTRITGIGYEYYGYAYALGIRIRSIGGKFTRDIHVNITSPVFVFLTCFLAFPESLKIFTFIMDIVAIMVRLGITSLGLDEQRHQRQRHSSTTEGLASELLKRVMCSIIAGIKGGWYPPRTEHQARNTHTEKNKRKGHSKQHA